MALPGINDYAVLGGEQVNYKPVTNPQTDIDASAWNEVKADTAAMTAVCDRAWVRFYWTGAATAVISHAEVWTSTLPTVTRSIAGEYVITWPSSVTDARGIIHYPNLRAGMGHGASMGKLINVSVIAPNQVAVYCYDAVANAAYDPGVEGVLVRVM
jgi:hypothetical protein